MNEHICKFNCKKCVNFKAKVIVDLMAGDMLIASRYFGEEKCMINCKNEKMRSFLHAPSLNTYELCLNMEEQLNETKNQTNS